MVGTWLLLALCPWGWSEPEARAGTEPDVRTAYEAAEAACGRDPEAHVRLALWCERHGLRAERARHLAIALLADPDHALARAMQGFVREGSRWLKPEQVAEQRRTDEERAAIWLDYEKRRAVAGRDVTSQLDLARWCEQNGLEAQARTHLISVVRLDPSRETTWKHLGYRKYNGRWMTEEQYESARAGVKAQAAATREWKPRLESLRDDLAEATSREAAETALSEIADPLVIPAIVDVFLTASVDDQRLAVQLLGQIDDPAATEVLASIALGSQYEAVRRVATETLSQRDPREYAGPLVSLVQKPLRWEVKPVGGPGDPGTLFVEGEKYNIQRSYRVAAPPRARPRRFRTGETLLVGADGAAAIAPPGAPLPPGNPNAAALAGRLQQNPGDMANILRTGLGGGPPAAPAAQAWGLSSDWTGPGLDPFTGWPSLSAPTRAQRRREAEEVNADLARRATLTAQARLQQDVQWVQSTNAQIQQSNDRVLPVLEGATGLAYGTETDQWRNWWFGQIGMQYQRSDNPKPTFTDDVYVSPSYQATTSCFAAGTLVHAETGLVPIETLKAGDLVLSQNVRTGALHYRPVTALHRNPPSTIYRVKLNEEIVPTSQFHRFWKAGHGWVMARELKPGDELRVLGGVAAVAEVQTGEVEPVFNLDVDEDHSFFVGRRGVLVHDNTLPDRRLVPFDRVEAVVSNSR